MVNKEQINQLTRKDIREMSKKFDLIKFYETQPHIAIIAITPYDVIIITSNFKEGEYRSHFDILDAIVILLKSLNRPQFEIQAFHCTSSDNEYDQEKQLIFSPYPSNKVYKRVTTKAMLEAIKLTTDIVCILAERYDISKVSWKNIKENYKFEEVDNIDTSEEVDIIEIPIDEYIFNLKEQLNRLLHGVGTFGDSDTISYTDIER